MTIPGTLMYSKHDVGVSIAGHVWQNSYNSRVFPFLVENITTSVTSRASLLVGVEMGLQSCMPVAVMRTSFVILHQIERSISLFLNSNA